MFYACAVCAFVCGLLGQAMKAEFASAALVGEKHWFQTGSQDELRTKINRSDDICGRMLDLLERDDFDTSS
jgi:hypothetical protein